MSHSKNHQKQDIYTRFPHQPMSIADISDKLKELGYTALEKGMFTLSIFIIKSGHPDSSILTMLLMNFMFYCIG